RAVGDQGLAVLHPHRARRLGVRQREAGRHARRLVDRLVVRVDGVLLVLGQTAPLLGRAWRRGGALVDQEHELHRFLLTGMDAYETNGNRRNRHVARKSLVYCAVPSWPSRSTCVSRGLSARSAASSSRPSSRRTISSCSQPWRGERPAATSARRSAASASASRSATT